MQWGVRCALPSWDLGLWQARVSHSEVRAVSSQFPTLSFLHTNTSLKYSHFKCNCLPLSLLSCHRLSTPVGGLLHRSVSYPAWGSSGCEPALSTCISFLPTWLPPCVAPHVSAGWWFFFFKLPSVSHLYYFLSLCKISFFFFSKYPFMLIVLFDNSLAPEALWTDGILTCLYPLWNLPEYTYLCIWNRLSSNVGHEVTLSWRVGVGWRPFRSTWWEEFLNGKTEMLKYLNIMKVTLLVYRSVNFGELSLVITVGKGLFPSP